MPDLSVLELLWEAASREPVVPEIDLLTQSPLCGPPAESCSSTVLEMSASASQCGPVNDLLRTATETVVARRQAAADEAARARARADRTPPPPRPSRHLGVDATFAPTTDSGKKRRLEVAGDGMDVDAQESRVLFPATPPAAVSARSSWNPSCLAEGARVPDTVKKPPGPTPAASDVVPVLSVSVATPRAEGCVVGTVDPQKQQPQQQPVVQCTASQQHLQEQLLQAAAPSSKLPLRSPLLPAQNRPYLISCPCCRNSRLTHRHRRRAC